MRSYLIAEFNILDATSWKNFTDAARPIVEAHGGEFVSLRARVVPLIGEPPENVTVIMFESLEKAQTYFHSPEYQGIIPLRDAAANYRAYIVESGDFAR